MPLLDQPNRLGAQRTAVQIYVDLSKASHARLHALQPGHRHARRTHTVHAHAPLVAACKLHLRVQHGDLVLKRRLPPRKTTSWLAYPKTAIHTDFTYERLGVGNEVRFQTRNCLTKG